MIASRLVVGELAVSQDSAREEGSLPVKCVGLTPMPFYFFLRIPKALLQIQQVKEKLRSIPSLFILERSVLG